ncbi:MAG: alpha/beta hydrolase [Candidatus Saccharibacteria bacterium]|nr:alpha/beta hydrolase [Rhodoferax sp.]
MHALYRSFETQAQIDAEYNASLLLAPGESPMSHFTAQAESARASIACSLNVPYGPTRAETLDIFPAAQARAPVLIFIHGGYWRALSSKDFSGVAMGLHRRGITTVLVDYALCPFVTVDEITRQVRAAAAWVLRHIAQYGGDPTRVGVGGHSAGGHLTAMCLQTEWARDYGLPRDPFAAAIAFSGLYDLAPLRYSYLQPMIQLDEGIIRRNSPAFAVRPCATPLWITWGSEESSEFARQSLTYHAAWQAAGNTALLQAQPAANHFSIIHGLEDSGSAVCNWLANALQNSQ